MIEYLLKPLNFRPLLKFNVSFWDLFIPENKALNKRQNFLEWPEFTASTLLQNITINDNLICT